ncbi:MAG: choice-of-anchor D domain-containing protein, partial [Myxococcota bacterium]|nr:choice-of-anchor D domain-containing protein [Myxococcota bacterium]
MTRANLVSIAGITLGLCLAACSDYSVRKGEGRLELSATSVDFGEVSVGAQSTVGLQATNVGMGTLAFLDAGLDDTTTESFDFLGLDHAELDPGDQMELQVRFVPEEVAQAYGNLTVETDDETWSLATVDLAAFGVQPTIDVDPETLWFGVVEVGGSNTLEGEIGAQGSGTLRIKELIFPGDEQDAYVVDLPEGVELPYELSPGLSFTMEVTFAPPDSEAYQGELIVSSNDSASSEVAITLIGNSEDDPTENSSPEVEITSPDWGDYLLTGETTTIQG